jgi:citrate synthase
MLRIVTIKCVYDPAKRISVTMNLSVFSEVPPKPEYNPVRDAIEASKDRPDVLAALKLFSSMPQSTTVFANPVRHHHEIALDNTILDLDIRSFTVRGKLFEEDIVSGKADAHGVIFVGLFGRHPSDDEAMAFRKYLATSLQLGIERCFEETHDFMQNFPDVSADIAIQHWASIRKAVHKVGPINSLRPSDELLREMIDVHMENVAVAALASAMRAKSPMATRTPEVSDAFQYLFSMLLRHNPNAHEKRILEQLGAIQIHHGSAGSNMVARYFASLHTRSVADLFTASQMALDCGRHFGAISDMTDFVAVLERTPESEHDNVIRGRILRGNLPTFGHPEIAAASRENHLEMDPRPALYLAPLFEAIDNGTVTVRPRVLKRAALLERMYQIALVEGVQKSPGAGKLRLTPNTDFGAWLVQEVLGIEEADRTLLSYSYRGFGWMMDVREQLQQPIIRPVIPPDPAILPTPQIGGTVPAVISSVHKRLVAGKAFNRTA